MTIDWTQPVETTEDPPRHVRVLATDLPAPWCIAAHVGTGDLVMRFKFDGEPYAGMPVLRNVLPPKPEPVLIEGWVNFVKASTAYEGGTYWVVRNGAVWMTKEAALIEAGKMSDVIGTARIPWMSDGSPVPASPEQFDQMREMAKLIQERDEWRTQCGQWAAKASAWVIEKDALKVSLEEARCQRDDASARVETLQSEVETLQAEADRQKAEADELRTHLVKALDVVDAAVAWAAQISVMRNRYDADLLTRVRAYQQTPKKTAAEAVANVAEMMGPVKTCETCRFGETKAAYDGCAFIRSITIECDRNGFSKWEAKSHD